TPAPSVVTLARSNTKVVPFNDKLLLKVEVPAVPGSPAAIIVAPEAVETLPLMVPAQARVCHPCNTKGTPETSRVAPEPTVSTGEFEMDPTLEATVTRANVP